MPVQTLERYARNSYTLSLSQLTPMSSSPGQILELIKESSKPVVVHYWAPWKGPNSPLAPIFWQASETRRDDVEFVIVESGFIHPEHTPDEMPLTVLYRDGEEVETAPFDPSQVEGLIERA